MSTPSPDSYTPAAKSPTPNIKTVGAACVYPEWPNVLVPYRGPYSYRASKGSESAQQHFDQVAHQYEFQFAIQKLDVPLLLEAAQIRRGERVLDLACGIGHVSDAAGTLVGEHGRVVAVDVSGKCIRLAQSQAPNVPCVQYRQGDMTSLDSVLSADERDRKFDVILCLNALYLLPEVEQQAALCHWKSFLSPGGRIVVSVEHREGFPHMLAVDGKVEERDGTYTVEFSHGISFDDEGDWVRTKEYASSLARASGLDLEPPTELRVSSDAITRHSRIQEMHAWELLFLQGTSNFDMDRWKVTNLTVQRQNQLVEETLPWVEYGFDRVVRNMSRKVVNLKPCSVLCVLRDVTEAPRTPSPRDKRDATVAYPTPESTNRPHRYRDTTIRQGTHAASASGGATARHAITPTRASSPSPRGASGPNLKQGTRVVNEAPASAFDVADKTETEDDHEVDDETETEDEL